MKAMNQFRIGREASPRRAFPFGPLRQRSLHPLTVSALCFFASQVCPAALITTNTFISIGDTTYNGQNLVVSNCTLTIDGAHPFASLQVLDGATVTHSNIGAQLTISGNVYVAPQGRVNVNGCGYSSGNGPGKGTSSGSPLSGSGGSYAGAGGASASGYLLVPPLPYGQVSRPVDKGSGGGSGTSPGGAGGGTISLDVLGTLRIEGIVSANGADSPGGRSGGGSGGSIYFKAQVLSGSGKVLANGGAGDPGQSGGGGGGRIAVEYGTNLFTGTVAAYGGNGYQTGGAGSIYLRQLNANNASLVFDNGGRKGGSSTFNLSGYYALVVTNAATLSMSSCSLVSLHAASGTVLSVSNATLNITSNLVVDSGALLTADGAGYRAGSGPGVGSTGYGGLMNASGGGGYGGCGGSTISARGGQTYGPFSNPAERGSGGGIYGVQPRDGSGSGGGTMRINIGGVLICNGRISANGNPGTANSSGGGSGGSIWLTVGTMAGAGRISADGGAGNGFGTYAGGGGGGGRVLVEYNGNLFFGKVSAFGGPGSTYAGAGTVYLKPKSQYTGLLIADNGGNSGTNTSWLSGPPVHLEVMRGAKVVPIGGTYYDVAIRSNSWLLPQGPGYTLTFSNLIVEAGAGISVDGMALSTGTGRGASSPNGSGGGGYGGFGAAGLAAAGGLTYGNSSSPMEAGSAGGSYPSSYAGGIGGGALRIIVSGTVQLDGLISANGGNATNSISGGGSGGSLYLTLGTFFGAGQIRANGGNGGADAGGGGGGRIAIIYTAKGFSGTISALGGGGRARGGAGTIYMKADRANAAQLLVDNGGFQGTNSSWGTVSSPIDLVIRNGAKVSPYSGQYVNSLLVGEGGWLWLSNQSLIVYSNAVIEVGAGITAAGTGNGSGLGTGAGKSANPGGTYTIAGGGAGYGGYGGDPIRTNSIPLGGAAFGYLTDVRDVGSGGGGYNGIGGSGGGAILLTVNGTLLVNGTITANGNPGLAPGGGGGSGGSVSLAVGTLAGAGLICANGGEGNGLAGGGGGGRIAIRYSTNLYQGGVTAYGGGPVTACGGAGVISFTPRTYLTPYFLVDNGGRKGTNTLVYNYAQRSIILEIRNGGVAWQYGPSLLLTDLIVGPDGEFTFQPSPTRAELVASGNVTVRAGGRVSVDAMGYAGGAGPGAGRTGNYMGSGAGYGGMGGDAPGVAGGAPYGVAEQPTDFGSGGGLGRGTTADMPRGGGALRMRVAGTCMVDGEISANGLGGIQDSAGGGSGGSIWLDAGALVGTGVIRADGGNGELYSGGGGAGGRIAVYSPLNLFSGAITASGGAGFGPGQNGTVFQASAPLPLLALSHSPIGTVTEAVFSVVLKFNTPVLSSSCSASDVQIATPAGLLPATNVSVALQSDARVVRVSFPAQTSEGLYTIKFGPNVQNLHLQPMSQTYTGAFNIVWATVAGTITNYFGQPMAGLTVSSSASGPVLTDSSGKYSIKVPPGDIVTIMPVKQDYSFDPPSRAYTDLRASVFNQDYVAMPTPRVALTAAASGSRLTWQGTEGLVYQPFYSTNLVDWTPLDIPVLCTNTAEPMGVPLIVTDKPQVFFKVQSSISN